jgi:hypothetical protein
VESLLSPREMQLMQVASQLMSSEHTSPAVSPRVASPRAASPRVASPRAQWTQSKPKFPPLNGTVFCRVATPFAAEKEGDLSAETGDVLACNENQDFAEEYWYGAKVDETVGYFPQASVVWIEQP